MMGITYDIQYIHLRKQICLGVHVFQYALLYRFANIPKWPQKMIMALSGRMPTYSIQILWLLRHADSNDQVQRTERKSSFQNLMLSNTIFIKHRSIVVKNALCICLSSYYFVIIRLNELIY